MLPLIVSALVLINVFAAESITRDEAVRRAVDAASAHAGAAQGAIVVQDAVPIEWPNLGLDCPAPGVIYPVGTVRGFRVIVGIGDATFTVHVTEERTAVCTGRVPARAPQRGAPGPGGSGACGKDARAVVSRARQDLAKRLSVANASIREVSCEAVTWPNGALGCPEPGRMYTQMLVEGLRITLEARGKRYEYHSGGARGPFYCRGNDAR